MVAAGLAMPLALTVATQAAHTQTFTVVHAFTGGSDGENPLDGFTIDAPGALR